MSKPQKTRRSLAPSPLNTEAGTLSIEPGQTQSKVTVIAYGPDALVEKQLGDISELVAACGTSPVVWINVDGLGDEKVLRALGERFHIHPLALEDVAHPRQRAKVDSYPQHDFMIVRMLTVDTKGGDRLGSEQVGLFLGSTYVLTFQERPDGDAFDPVRERLRHSKGRLRAQGPDALAVALLDAVIDDYFPVLEHYGDLLEDLEEEILGHWSARTLARLNACKRELLKVRRSVWPLRDALATLGREESAFLKADSRPYLRDLHDHTVQVMDLVETYRDLGSGMVDLYLSSSSNRLSEVMKVLTIISTIFIPLSFIAGLYGMNFDRASPFNMPELSWQYGYPMALGMMATVALGLTIFFYRKGWLTGPPN
jgi:magnesium transporter